jgi:two-component system, NtrC family, nitrogen regulation sensor histidine kinase NtrY
LLSISKMRKSRASAILLTAASMLLFSLLFNVLKRRDLSAISKTAGQRIGQKLKRCDDVISNLRAAHAKELPAGIFENEKIGLYLFKGDSLVAWNNSQLAPEPSLKAYSKTKGVAFQKHGAYLYSIQRTADTTAVALVLLRPAYEIENNYLINNFQDWTGIPPDVTFGQDSTGYLVEADGSALFSIKGNEAGYSLPWVDDLCAAIFIFGSFLLLLGFIILLKSDAPGTGFWLITGSIALRVIMLVFKWPAFLYNSVLYDVRIFGNAQSHINGYLGDILINSVFLIFIAAALYIHSPAQRKGRLLHGTLLSILLFFLVYFFNHSLASLVRNSTLNFDFLNIFNINIPSVVALVAVCAYSLAIFVTCKKLIALLSPRIPIAAAALTLIVLAICVLMGFFFPGSDLFSDYWLLGYVFILFLTLRLANARASLALGLQVVIMSAITARLLNAHIVENEKQDLSILSLKLSERQDPILENEFEHIPARLASDESFMNLMRILPSTDESIQQLLNQRYFNEYFRRYNVEFSLFDQNCTPLLTTKDPVLLNEGFFKDQLSYYSDSTFVKGLYFVKGYRRNSRYIGRITLDDKRMYIMMQPKQSEEMGSFPDLLLDQSQQRPEKLKNFSHAVYRSNQNTSTFGNLNYPLFLPDPEILSRSEPGYIHHYFSPDEFTNIIISRPVKTLGYFFTFNSYLLLIFSLVTYGCYLIYALAFTSEFREASLTRRIQTIIIILLLMAMSAVGITSGRLVKRQFNDENRKQLKEKTEIIVNELYSQFRPEMLLDESQKEAVKLKLNEYARLFNTDISLFNKNGILFSTSQPRLYNQGLAAPFANPVALRNLRNNVASSSTIYEKAGKLNYMSLYTPLFNQDKEAIGFINLPYFARQNDLVNELSGIISALVNVYVILFVISILAGLVLSGYITRPLRLIQQQIANITLGRQNEKISWQSNDEIGKLIAEYNHMLLKLEHSAGLLAQSERESAWREMAKQVAHEIKNPLTPMKLNLQYLQHLMKSDPADFKEKFQKASAGIIEQIDSLANIANEFSHFAKLPNTQLQVINLAEVINTSLLIFENQKNITIRNRIIEDDIPVKGDRDQCLRVFNNILTNAVQALDSVNDATIEIGRRNSEKTVIILIRDNGSGIDEELKPRIFMPNFTTKSTGSGLGLAIVKNIMEGFDGRIWFESEKGLGTIFYLEFTKA